MADSSPTTPAAGDRVPATERPPAHVVAAAERDYRTTLGRLDEVTGSVRSLLAHGWTDIEAMAYVAASLRVQQDLPATWFLAAVSIVERAKTPDPPERDPSNTPPTAPQTDHPAGRQHTGWRRTLRTLTRPVRRFLPQTNGPEARPGHQDATPPNDDQSLKGPLP